MTSNDQADSALYSSIDLTWDEEDTPDGNTTWVHPLVPLLRTLLRRPELTKHIRAITYGHRNRFQPWKPSGTFLILPDHPLEEAIALVERTGLPYRHTWNQGLRKGSIDAYLAVLLTQLPHLEHLYLGPDVFIEGDILGPVLRSILCDTQNSSESAFPGAQPGSLHLLQNVRLDRELNRYCALPHMKINNTADVLPFFYVPSITHLRLSIDPPDTPSLWPTALPPPPCNQLVSLTIEELREPHLGPLLSVTPHLRSLNWLWHWFDDHTTNPIINMGLIMSAIEHVKPTLAELNIHAYADNESGLVRDAPLSIENLAQANTLSTFPQLTKLTIPLVFLTGFDISKDNNNNKNNPPTPMPNLPPSIEYLTLLDDLIVESREATAWTEAAYTSIVMQFLENVKICAPRLKRLVLFFGRVDYHHYGDVDKDDIMANTRNATGIKELASRQGIQVEILEEMPQFPETGWGSGL